jgi:hypothetical protein
MFFAEKPESLDQQALGWVQILLSALARYGKLVPTANKKKRDRNWCSQFVLLRQEFGENKVSKVLEWYCKNIDGEYVPQAYAAASFRSKFMRIENAMLSQSDALPEPSDRDKELARRLMDELTWPPEIMASLPEVIRRTRENWSAFVKKMESHLFSHPPSRDVVFMRESITSYSPLFVEQWMLFLNRKWRTCTHYTGKIDTLCFRPQAKDFHLSFWTDWSFQWSGSPNTFDSLLEELLK